MWEIDQPGEGDRGGRESKKRLSYSPRTHTPRGKRLGTKAIRPSQGTFKIQSAEKSGGQGRKKRGKCISGRRRRQGSYPKKEKMTGNFKGSLTVQPMAHREGKRMQIWKTKRTYMGRKKKEKGKEGYIVVSHSPHLYSEGEGEQYGSVVERKRVKK